MIVLSFIAVVWLFVGAVVGWKKARESYTKEVSRVQVLVKDGRCADPAYWRRQAAIDAAGEFLLWVALGVLGAIITAAMYVFWVVVSAWMHEHTKK